MGKRRVLIADHGMFTLFDMNISLPAIIELSEEQINYINTSGLYRIQELNATQLNKSIPTTLNSIDGERFENRTFSVNELAYKAPIMGSEFADKAKNAIVVKKGSLYARAAMKQSNPSTMQVKSTSGGKVKAEEKPILSNAPITVEEPKNTKKNEPKADKEKDVK